MNPKERAALVAAEAVEFKRVWVNDGEGNRAQISNQLAKDLKIEYRIEGESHPVPQYVYDEVKELMFRKQSQQTNNNLEELRLKIALLKAEKDLEAERARLATVPQSVPQYQMFGTDTGGMYAEANPDYVEPARDTSEPLLHKKVDSFGRIQYV